MKATAKGRISMSRRADRAVERFCLAFVRLAASLRGRAARSQRPQPPRNGRRQRDRGEVSIGVKIIFSRFVDDAQTVDFSRSGIGDNPVNLSGPPTRPDSAGFEHRPQTSDWTVFCWPRGTSRQETLDLEFFSAHPRRFVPMEAEMLARCSRPVNHASTPALPWGRRPRSPPPPG